MKNKLQSSIIVSERKKSNMLQSLLRLEERNQSYVEEESNSIELQMRHSDIDVNQLGFRDSQSLIKIKWISETFRHGWMMIEWGAAPTEKECHLAGVQILVAGSLQIVFYKLKLHLKSAKRHFAVIPSIFLAAVVPLAEPFVTDRLTSTISN